MSEPKETPDDVIRRLSAGDQNDTALRNLAHMAFVLWTGFVDEGLTSEVATELTATWLCELIQRSS